MFHQRATRKPTKSEAGAAIESAALAWLEARGLVCVERNFRCRGGEIDLVMREAGTLIFVEVRLRNHRGFGSAAESVTSAKQRRLIRAAQYYLATHGATDIACRFDVLAAKLEGETIVWEWVPDAFCAG